MVKARESHIFERQPNDHYVEEVWCSRRLFDEEEFEGPILDPCCGWGRILDSAKAKGFETFGSDVVDRGCHHTFKQVDFLHLHEEAMFDWWRKSRSIVCNPPFNLIREFSERALSLTKDLFTPGKVAMIFPLRRLPAATWLRMTPLSRVLLMNPRPSMPTGEYIKSGGKVGGGTQDFCWLIWDHLNPSPTRMDWLRRDADD